MTNNDLGPAFGFLLAGMLGLFALIALAKGGTGGAFGWLTDLLEGCF